MTVTADYDAQTAVERELVLRLASLLWRLRRATAIEAGLFKLQARQLLQFRRGRRAHYDRQKIIDSLCRNAVAAEDDLPQDQNQLTDGTETGLSSAVEPDDQSDDVTRAFIRLNNVPSCPSTG
jgi:hypothetical protein